MDCTRFRIQALAVGMGLSLALMGPATAAVTRQAFVSEQTSAIEGIGDYTSMQLDQMGRTHVAYFDQARDAQNTIKVIIDCQA